MLSLNVSILAGALCWDAAFGYPAPVFRAIRHPVVWVGALITVLDRALNREGAPVPIRRAAGVLSIAVVVGAAALPAAALQLWAQQSLPSVVALVLLGTMAASLIAQRSLAAHVQAVADGLDAGLDAGRAAVAQIVGRDPASLDDAGVARAAIESLAENFADGVVAPAVWCAIGGLPGIAAYKAINTADSMIGHRTPRHLWFGWASARLDDLVNLPGSRLAAVWLMLAALLHRGAHARGALQATLRDARGHRSPNAGWPEAALAGALGLRLAGPRRYHGVVAEDPWMGDGRAEATSNDIRAALRLYRTACGLQISVSLIAAAAIASS